MQPSGRYGPDVVRDVEGARRPVDVGFAPTANNPSDYFSGAETAGSNPVTPIQYLQGFSDLETLVFLSTILSTIFTA